MDAVKLTGLEFLAKNVLLGKSPGPALHPKVGHSREYRVEFCRVGGFCGYQKLGRGRGVFRPHTFLMLILSPPLYLKAHPECRGAGPVGAGRFARQGSEVRKLPQNLSTFREPGLGA